MVEYKQVFTHMVSIILLGYIFGLIYYSRIAILKKGTAYGNFIYFLTIFVDSYLN